MPLTLIFLLAVVVAAFAVAAYALQTDRARRTVLSRFDDAAAGGALVLKPPKPSPGARIASWLQEHAPASLMAKEDVNNTLVHAGFDGASAPAVYAALRIASVVVIPVVAFLAAPRGNQLYFLLFCVIGAAIGLMAPSAALNRMAQTRQDRLRRSLPDSMDLLVVCVEAGISLDAALQRVAREMALLHPDLANELMIVNRRVNAGMSRERALHGLWLRTGVEDLRALSSNMIQSERWGTSIATVLRVYAEGLRRKRKQAAEKKAALAPMKMLFPLALFIFPTIFVVLLGPAAIKISAAFAEVGQ